MGYLTIVSEIMLLGNKEIVLKCGIIVKFS